MKKIILMTFFISALFSTEFDSEDGAPLRQGVHVEWFRTVSPGNSGEAIFIWSDTRFGMRNIFAHKVNQAGDLLWGETGTIVTNLPGRQEDPVSISDGNGGVFIGWIDYRFDAEGDVFIQHLDSNGNILLDENGIALALIPGKQISINMCTDSLGGVFVTWQDKRGGIDEDIYGTHITANHDIISPGSGVPIVVAGGNQNAKSIEYAGNNEAFIAWVDYRDGANANIYGQRLDAIMTNQFEENGIPIANTSNQELKPRVTFMSEETSFIVWKNGDQDSRLKYQLVDSEGLVFSESSFISDFNAIQTAPRVKRSAIGEVFVNWKDLRFDATDGDQYFQKIDINGEIQWGEGILLDENEFTNFSARFSAGQNGDVNIAYELGTFPNIEIMMQNISSEGSFSFSTPLNISNKDGYQFAPNLIGTVESGLFVIYADESSGSIDLKVQKVESGYLPSWDDNGITAMFGLGGDINYTSSYRVDDGEIYFFWEDNRSTKKIYGSRITDNELQFENGLQLSFSDNSSAVLDDSKPVIMHTDNGNYVATFDGSSSPKIIRINKLSNELENVWADSGIALSAVWDMRQAILIETDEGVGCFWSESRAFNYDIYYQKLDADGNILLDEQGIELIVSNGDDYLLGAIPSPDGNLFIFWMEDAWPNAVLKYTKIDYDGNIAIGWNPNGNALSNSSIDSRFLKVKPINNETGILAVWIQKNPFADIAAQVISWDGDIVFPEGGVVITDAENDQGASGYFSFDVNETGTKSFLTWEDNRSGENFEIFGQILNLSNGSLIEDPIQFTSVVMDTLHNYNPLVTSIQDDEFMVLWEDGRGYINEDPLLINGVDLYGSGDVIGQGMTTEINGFPVCIAYHKQLDVNVSNNSGEEYFLSWVDYRSSGKEDLANFYGRTLMKAVLLSNDSNCDKCEVPNQFSLNSAYPNPFNGQVNFDFKVPAHEAVEFRIYDITGRVVLNKLILPGFGGNYTVSWNGKNSLGELAPTGIYFYEFKTSDTIEQGKITYLK